MMDDLVGRTHDVKMRTRNICDEKWLELTFHNPRLLQAHRLKNAGVGVPEMSALSLSYLFRPPSRSPRTRMKWRCSRLGAGERNIRGNG
jgi:hypothetical protein